MVTISGFSRGVWRFKLRRWKRIIYSVFTNDTLDAKGKARDTRVHVTL